MKLLGKLNIGQKVFSAKDSIGKISVSQLGFTDDFYGGFVKNFYKTKEGFLLCLDRRDNIVNVGYIDGKLTDEGIEILEGKYIENSVNYENMELKDLKVLAKEKEIEFPKNANKEKMIELLRGDSVEKNEEE